MKWESGELVGTVKKNVNDQANDCFSQAICHKKFQLFSNGTNVITIPRLRSLLRYCPLAQY